MRTLACFFAVIAAAAAQFPYSVLAADPQSAFEIRGLPETNKKIVPVTGMPFPWAWQLRTPPNTDTQPWDFRLYAEGARAVSQGDLLLARFWVRTIRADAGVGLVRLIVERNSEPWTKSADTTAAAEPGGGWKKVELPFRMLESYAAGSYSIQFWFTFDPQTIEVGGFTVENHGPDADWRDFGLESYPYEGHEPSAAWRTDAAARIERYRKSDIVVVARDADGNPLANAPVRVRMKRHEFRFGTAIAASYVNDPAREDYRRKVAERFNTVVIENALKWGPWLSDRKRAIDAVDWARSAGLSVRGHNIVWPGWRHTPDWLEGQAGNPEQLRRSVRDHMREIASAMRGKLIDWDVINEPYSNHDLMDILGDAEMAEWFKIARAEDPGAALYVNEYDLVTGAGWNLRQHDYYRKLIPWLDSLGTPIDGIGIQSHFGTDITSPERALEVFDLFASFGKDLLVTEFTHETLDEQLQAGYLRDFLTTAFSHPAIKGFYLWVFWEGKGWRPAAALYRTDWSAKPNGRVWEDLIFNEWWTDVAGATDEKGIFRTRGFLGEYDVEISGPGGAQVVALATGDDRSPHYATTGKQTPGSFPADGVVNAASFRGGAVAPGEIVTIYGTGFGMEPIAHAVYEDRRLHRYAGDTKVYFDGQPAPMIYSLTGQVSAIVPYSVSGMTTIEVEQLGTRAPPVAVPVSAAAPAIFCYAGGAGQAVVVNGSGAFNGPENPVARGGVLTLFLTGEGAVRPAIGDGVLPKGPDFPAPARAFGAYIGGKKCTVEFVGLVYAGVTQVNVRVPNDAPAGDAASLQVVVAGVASPTNVTIAVR